ncbi:MAG: hypothetical protein M1834_009656 [Cirrosporium novae-zelandiae]|nr:MAG: hypothetical protein M1834_009656 [Cirrosporium novae-zelandiae]
MARKSVPKSNPRKSTTLALKVKKPLVKKCKTKKAANNRATGVVVAGEANILGVEEANILSLEEEAAMTLLAQRDEAMAAVRKLGEEMDEYGDGDTVVDNDEEK